MEIQPGQIFQFKYGSSSYDGRPGYVGPHWGEVKVVSINGSNVKLHKKIKGKFDPTSEFTSSVPALKKMMQDPTNPGTQKNEMKLSKLLEKQRLEEKKEAIATSPHTNITLHYDSDFKQVGEEGTPEASFTISMSSTGGKEFFRSVSDSDEGAKMAEGVRLELRRALRRFDKRVALIMQKYKLRTR